MSALTNLPGKYSTFSTAPSTETRFECTLKTFMKTLILSASRLAYGSMVFSTTTMRPSAGASTALGADGIGRGGSRKNCSTNTVMIHSGSAHQKPALACTSSEMTKAPARNGQPSRAISG
ncbi:hypothetical protein D3C72_1342100 [compost metagenome]